MRKALLLVFALTGVFAVPSPSPAAFCNLTGFQHCDVLNGTSCVVGSTRRCYVYPQYCEWGACRCPTGTWICVY